MARTVLWSSSGRRSGGATRPTPIPNSSAKSSRYGKVLFDAYLAWADEENLPSREVWTRRTFFGALEERGLTKRKTNKGIAFDGVRRARQTDAVPDHDQPERAEDGSPALSSPTSIATAPSLSGADLDAVL